MTSTFALTLGFLLGSVMGMLLTVIILALQLYISESNRESRTRTPIQG